MFTFACFFGIGWPRHAADLELLQKDKIISIGWAEAAGVRSCLV